MTLRDLEPTRFVRRHIGPDDAEQAAMLATLGLSSLDELARATVPAGIRDDGPLAIPDAADEAAVADELAALAARNTVLVSLLGTGYADTVTPPVIQRNVLENPAWYTAYTPYQPEIAQGRLEALLNFQTMVADLTGMGLANASLLDESTAAAEAMALCHRVNQQAGTTFVVDPGAHPQTIGVVQTRAAALGLDVHVARPRRRPARRRVRGVAPRAGHHRPGPRPARDDRRAARPRGARRRRGRPPRLHAARPAGGAGRRRRRRLGAALRGATRLRGTPRRVPRHPRRVPAQRPRPARRRVRRHRRPPRAPPRPPDPRAAHPPRARHQQHLHRAGAPRGHRRALRRVPRSRGARPDRGARPPARRRARRRAARRHGRRAPRRRLRHGRRPGAGPRRRGRGGRPGRRRQPAGRRPRHGGHRARRDDHTDDRRDRLAGLRLRRDRRRARRTRRRPRCRRR